MELKEIKCTNCGASLKVSETEEKVTCKYCNTEFYIEDAFNEAYKTEKGKMQARIEGVEEIGKKVYNSPVSKMTRIIIIIIILIAVTIFIGLGYAFISQFKSIDEESNKIKNRADEIQEKVREEQNKQKEENKKFEIEMFNQQYETIAGETSGFFIKSTLNEVITNNKKNKEHIITVVYTDIESTQENDIFNIIDKIESKNYKVSLDYDKEGYVNKIIIKE